MCAQTPGGTPAETAAACAFLSAPSRLSERVEKRVGGGAGCQEAVLINAN